MPKQPSPVMRRQHPSRKRIQQLAENAETLEALNRDANTRFLCGYLVALGRLYQDMEHFRRWFEKLEHFAPCVRYIDAIEAETDELARWIGDCLDGKRDQAELQQLIDDSLLEGLSGILDAAPGLEMKRPARPSKALDSMREDVEALVERLCEDIADRGYKLHEVLCTPPKPYHW